MEPTPDREWPGYGRPYAPTPPPGAFGPAAASPPPPYGHPGAGPYAAAPHAPVPGAPAPWPSAQWAQDGGAGAFVPPRRPDRSPVVWVAVGAAAVTSVAAFALCALLVVMAPPPQQSQGPPASADPARYTSREFAARPSAVKVDIDDHPVYELPMPEQVACDVPELDPESGSSWDAFSNRLGDCLGELWRPRLEKLGLRTPEPEFRISHTDPDSGSGGEDLTLAYYEMEPMAITVFMPNVGELSRYMPDSSHEAVFGALMAHEYGHHVQRLTGILDVSYELEREAADEGARLEQLRRTELQAECLAGVGLRGLKPFGRSEIDRANDLINGGGDLDSHGSTANRRRWFDKGARLDTIGACNTHAAPDAQVE
ncbi:neutral zinc metallopeptidase [Streptomonospora litoralis]|uniref:Neutral zinc metallopeptidase n=1 Tax=Streptomonospora litoralis TaxID=2498135 RepID=A0A4P6Q7B8_9ACTN|nr:neutral zinc metallopeptidase [Streptomonospora litoralis]QBI54707.1 Putative neutral zinc metallopeptidase [Streptomonospora litoralis]